MKIKEVSNQGERTSPEELNLFEFKRIYYHVIENYGNENKKVLDYGCGSGYGTYMLSQHFGTSIGVDISETAINFCKSNFKNENLKFEILDTTVQPFEDHSFDNIFSFQVFEHIPLEMTTEYVNRIWHMLKPSGVAILTTPNSKNYYGGRSRNKFHIKEYTIAELESIFNNVIPKQQYKIYSIEDVLSTQIRIKIVRFFKNRFVGKVLGRGLEVFIKYLEKFRIVKIRNRIIKENSSNVIGSFYCVIHKKDNR